MRTITAAIRITAPAPATSVHSESKRAADRLSAATTAAVPIITAATATPSVTVSARDRSTPPSSQSCDHRLRSSPMQRRRGLFILAAAGWTAFVWLNRIRNLASDDRSLGFLVVHYVIAGVSLAFAAGLGVIGWRMATAQATKTSTATDANNSDK